MFQRLLYFAAGSVATDAIVLINLLYCIYMLYCRRLLVVLVAHPWPPMSLAIILNAGTPLDCCSCLHVLSKYASCLSAIDFNLLDCTYGD